MQNWQENDNYQSTQFPCPRNGNLVDLGLCSSCENRNYCDIRALMLDELVEDSE